jgi:hypothetical protein
LTKIIKGRLDGVTFSGIDRSKSLRSTLRVREKYLFKRKFQLRRNKNAELFYNEPEEMKVK